MLGAALEMSRMNDKMLIIIMIFTVSIYFELVNYFNPKQKKTEDYSYPYEKHNTVIVKRGHWCSHIYGSYECWKIQQEETAIYDEIIT